MRGLRERGRRISRVFRFVPGCDVVGSQRKVGIAAGGWAAHCFELACSWFDGSISCRVRPTHSSIFGQGELCSSCFRILKGLE